MWNDTKVIVTSNCPTCKKDWTRETYLVCIGFAALEICPDCTEYDEYGNLLITMSDKVYERYEP